MNRLETEAYASLCAHLRAGDLESLADALAWSTDTPAATLPDDIWHTWGLGRAPEHLRLTALAMRPGARLLGATGELTYAERRKLALDAWRHNPVDLLVWWYLGDEDFTLAMVDAGTFRSMTMRRVDPHPSALGRLASLSLERLVAVDARDLPDALGAHVRGVLAIEDLTRAFFGAFTRCFSLLREQMLRGPEDAQARHDVALLTLLRLIVLHFLEARGALDADPRFLARAWRRARVTGDDLYAEVLGPLFFGALNRPRDAREPSVQELGRFPFLNGGLFEPSVVERAHPDLTWPLEVWDTLFSSLFERFPFALGEVDREDGRVGVDPEVLGRVFEGLMYADARKDTGSFYTPRPLVASMVRDALSGVLSERTGVEEARLRALIERGRFEGSAAERAALTGELSELTILDPAVGTGAFLLEALFALQRIWEGLRPEAGAKTYAGTRRLIHRHLYGVDLHPAAVRLCELRLWLAMLGTLEADVDPIEGLEPLPNLGHRILAGDSLLGALDLLRLRDADGAVSWVGEGAEVRERVATLEDDAGAYLTAHGARKRELAARLERGQRGLERVLLERRVARLDARLVPLDNLEGAPDLFGRPRALTTPQRKARDAWRAERAGLMRGLDRLEARAGAGFGYEVQFADVMRRGGFDVVVMNPPWVRAERRARGRNQQLRARYETAGAGLWPGAQALGVTAPFGTQTELAGLFVERACELCRPGGWIAALVPAKLARALHSAPLRALLARHDVRAVEDLSDAEGALFDATTYPMVLHVQPRAKGRRPAERPVRVRVARPTGDVDVWEAPIASLTIRGEHPGEPWMLVTPEQRALVRQMNLSGPTLGSLMTPRRGVMTGRNDVFLCTPEWAREVGAEPWTRPVVTGRDIGPWEARAPQRILWLHDAQGAALERAPTDALARHFTSHRARLEARSDWRPGMPLWRLFRVQEGLMSPKVVWRDLGPALQAAPVPASVVPLNTAYYLPCADDLRAWALCAWLNSAPVRAYARGLAERARGGWRRHFAWVIAMLPVPGPMATWLATPDAPVPAELAPLLMLRAPGVRQDEVAIDRVVRALYEAGAGRAKEVG